MTIVVVEDELPMARHLVSALRRQGHHVTACHDGPPAQQEIMRIQPDLIILDLNLPTFDGLELLTRLRRDRCSARVIVLTARGEIDDRVAGLRAGADDYQPKPFAMAELLARVEALGRRTIAPVSTGKFSVADLQVDAVHRRVVRAGRLIELTPREFELLQAFLAEPGRVFSRGELSEQVWQRDHHYDTRTVEMFIARLRRKIDPPDLPPLLHTVRSVGYVLQSEAPHEP